MYVGLFLIFSAIAGVCTYNWLIARENAVFETAMLAFATWAYLALVGGTITFVDPAASDPEYVLSIGGGTQLFMIALALLSIAAAVGERLDAYPPEDTDVVDQELIP